MYRAAAQRCQSGEPRSGTGGPQGRISRTRRRGPGSGAAARNRHPRPRSRRRRGARSGQGAAQSSGRRRAHPACPRRGAAASLRHRRGVLAAGAVSQSGRLRDRGRQDFHAAVGRPASGKLGSGGAREGDRRTHPGPNRRAPWSRCGTRRRRRHHPRGDHDHAQAAERARGRALSRRARHFAQRSRKRRSRYSTARRAKARAAFPPTSMSRRRSASPASDRTRLGSKSGPTRRSNATLIASRSMPTPLGFR